MGDNSKLTSYFFAVELELDDAYASDSSGDSFWSKFADGVQASLDIAGLVLGVGEIADGVNALISLGRGDVAGAALFLRFFFVPSSGSSWILLGRWWLWLRLRLG